VALAYPRARVRAGYPELAGARPVQRSLYADPEMEYHEAVQFYQHDIDWANRLILGD